jgi:hypothetical protein
LKDVLLYILFRCHQIQFSMDVKKRSRSSSPEKPETKRRKVTEKKPKKAFSYGSGIRRILAKHATSISDKEWGVAADGKEYLSQLSANVISLLTEECVSLAKADDMTTIKPRTLILATRRVLGDEISSILFDGYRKAFEKEGKAEDPKEAEKQKALLALL